MNEVTKIILSLKPIGDPIISGQQLKYDCPRCGDLGIGKHNLEIKQKDNVFKCWACGYSGYITKLIKDFGRKEFIDSFQKKGFKNLDVKEVKTLVLPDRLSNVFSLDFPYNYLTKKRHIPDKQIKERGIKFCLSGIYKDSLIFPSYNLEKQLTGYVVHNLKTFKYRNIIDKVNFTCFYENLIDKFSPIFLTEGVYDALSIPNAIPLLGTDIKDNMLNFLCGTDVVLILDNDVNETKLNYNEKKLKSVTNTVRVHKLDKYKDLNEIRAKDFNFLKEIVARYI